MTKRYTPAGASQYLLDHYGLSRTPRTLSNLRCKGGGPRYIRISHKEVVYEQDMLDQWADSLYSPSVANTAQEAPQEVA